MQASSGSALEDLLVGSSTNITWNQLNIFLWPECFHQRLPGDYLKRGKGQAQGPVRGARIYGYCPC